MNVYILIKHGKTGTQILDVFSDEEDAEDHREEIQESDPKNNYLIEPFEVVK